MNNKHRPSSSTPPSTERRPYRIDDQLALLRSILLQEIECCQHDPTSTIHLFNILTARPRTDQDSVRLPTERLSTWLCRHQNRHCLTKYLNKHNNNEPSIPVSGCEKRRMYVEIPFIGKQTEMMKKKISRLTAESRPDLDIR